MARVYSVDFGSKKLTGVNQISWNRSIVRDRQVLGSAQRLSKSLIGPLPMFGFNRLGSLVNGIHGILQFEDRRQFALNGVETEIYKWRSLPPISKANTLDRFYSYPELN